MNPSPPRGAVVAPRTAAQVAADHRASVARARRSGWPTPELARRALAVLIGSSS